MKSNSLDRFGYDAGVAAPDSGQDGATGKRVPLVLEDFSAHKCAVSELGTEDLLLNVHIIWLPPTQHLRSNQWINELLEPGRHTIGHQW